MFVFGAREENHLLCDLRGNGLARTTPCGEEVDENNGVLGQRLLEAVGALSCQLELKTGLVGVRRGASLRPRRLCLERGHNTHVSMLWTVMFAFVEWKGLLDAIDSVVGALNLERCCCVCRRSCRDIDNDVCQEQMTNGFIECAAAESLLTI